MFAGIDSESIFTVESSPKLSRSKSAVIPNHSSSSRANNGSNHHRHRSNAGKANYQNPFLDPAEIARRESMREEEFGWSGSAAGIRGRDDRQIERDAEYERQMEERRKKRHERKLARQQRKHEQEQARIPTPSPGGSRASVSGEPPSYDKANKASKSQRRPVFAPTEQDLERVNNSQISPTDTTPSKRLIGTGSASNNNSPSSNNLSRGKSLRDKVGAALGRWNSITRSKSMARSKSVGAIDAPPPIKPEDQHPPQPGADQRKEGLMRKLSRKITIEDQERRRKEREQLVYAEPPLLSHTLVGPASPFPMRPALSTLVPAEGLRYGEAHTDYSPNPYRRRNMSESHRFRAEPTKNAA